MRSVVTWSYEVRASAYPDGEPEEHDDIHEAYEDLREAPLTMHDLRAMVEQCSSLPPEHEVRYVLPVNGGDPQGWGLKVEVTT